jgi:hypothetical protein
MITPPIAGLMIDLLDPLSDSLNLSHLGYKSIFVLSSLLLLAAVALVRQIHVSNVRRLLPLVDHRCSCRRVADLAATTADRQVEVLGEAGEGGMGQEMRTLAANHDRATSSS